MTEDRQYDQGRRKREEGKNICTASSSFFLPPSSFLLDGIIDEMNEALAA